MLLTDAARGSVDPKLPPTGNYFNATGHRYVPSRTTEYYRQAGNMRMLILKPFL